MAEHLEIERKFEVEPDFERPDFGAVIGDVTASEPETLHLSATYFDTPDLRLAAAKATLRRRTGGPDEGWHLKLPVAADTRRELREPLSDELPGPLAARVAEITQGAPVAPIAILDTERTVVTLSVNGALVAEIADDTVTARRVSGGHGASGNHGVPGNHDVPGNHGASEAQPPLRWREIEIEVPDPHAPAAESAARLLTEAGARPARSSSKLARLLGS